MLAPRADLRAARKRVPSGFRPLNCGVRRHDLPRPAPQTIEAGGRERRTLEPLAQDLCYITAAVQNGDHL